MRRESTGASGCAVRHVLTEGEYWRVGDVVCTSGPQDRPFEEQHSQVSIAIVVAGSFEYRGAIGGVRTRSELMTPGSLLLGSAGQCFECGHAHGRGDRCISFSYAPDYFEDLAAEAGASRLHVPFRKLRLPALRELSPLIVRACRGLTASSEISWEELSVRLAALTAQLLDGVAEHAITLPPGAYARVSRVVRMLEQSPERHWTLRSLASEARVSSFHFLRTFEAITGVTPHQFLLRIRLRDAALRLSSEDKILDVALDSGFGDVSNFNRAFRREFGMSPRQFRRKAS